MAAAVEQFYAVPERAVEDGLVFSATESLSAGCEIDDVVHITHRRPIQLRWIWITSLVRMNLSGSVITRPT